MQKIIGLYLNGCTYCKNARLSIEELIKENPEYGKVPVEWYEETEHPEISKQFSYYYVPSLFIGQEKLYEAQPGQSYDEIKAHVKATFDAALKA